MASDIYWNTGKCIDCVHQGVATGYSLADIAQLWLHCI